jgi:hypothetical protein
VNISPIGARAVPWLFLAVAVASGLGCAFTDVVVTPPPRASVVTGSHRGQGRAIVVRRPFTDRRSNQQCGMKKNGFNSESAKIVCASDPSLALGDLVAAELAASGFKVLRDEKQAGPTTVVLTGTLTQVFVEPTFGFASSDVETDIGLKLHAQTRDGLAADRTFYVKGDEAIMMMSDENIQRSFDSSVRQLVTSVVGAVANLLDVAQADASPPPPPSGSLP